MAGWPVSDATLLSLEDGGRPVDALVALAELAHAHLSVRQTAIAQRMLRDALKEINGWCAERRRGAAVH